MTSLSKDDRTNKRSDHRTAFSLGIDLGSISLKVALLDETNAVCFSRWTRVAGEPLAALAAIADEIASSFPEFQIGAIGVTGSGRALVADAIGRPLNEITAQARAAARLHPAVRTIIEIGGQDSKLIILEEGAHAIRDFHMNELCAAGTGAFLDQQAARLGLSIERFAALAEEATEPAPIAGRCAVFAKTDMIHHQQEGRPLAEIVAGLNEALVRSYLANLVRGRALPTPIAIQGGVASNAGLVAAFRRVLELEGDAIVVPQEHRVMGAIGAALIAREEPFSKPLPLTALVGHLRPPAREPRNARTAKPLARPRGEAHGQALARTPRAGTFLGIDVGSVSVKYALVGPAGIVRERYRFSDGRPLECLAALLAEERSAFVDAEVRGVGVTGSGRHFVAALVGADAVINEITAQAMGAAAILPEADTLVEIGGQDAKFIRLADGRPQHFAMNKVCAAGTGAFLQEQAERLGVALDGDFSKRAFASERPAQLGNRCTVFMESDLVAHQQRGAAKADLLAGLARSVVANYREKVVAGARFGRRLLFTGGVARNAAVVAALEEAVGAPTATSALGSISGAIGAALAAEEALRAGRFAQTRFDPARPLPNFEQFTCEACPNRCRITRIAGEEGATIGGRCGKWDRTQRKQVTDEPSLLVLRNELLNAPSQHRTTGNEIQRPTKETKHDRITNHESRITKIGIPRALMAYDMLPAWRHFFEALGCEVVVSPPSNAALFAEGMRRLVVETCLPVKALCAHLVWLEAHGNCDRIFVPSIVSTGTCRHGKETLHCPYVQSAAQFAKPLVTTPLIDPAISWRRHPRDWERTMVDVAAALGVGRTRARLAWREAAALLDERRAAIRALGAEALERLRHGAIDRCFLLLGKDYTLSDPMLNSRAVRLLGERGEAVVTQDMLVADDGAYDERHRTMYWSHGKEILAGAELAAHTPGLVPVLISSFGCGPDSFTIDAARDLLGQTPFLHLEVDEHSSSVGMETRIEAFLDSLPARTVDDAPAHAPAIRRGGIRRVFLPHFSDHGIAFAAALRAIGFEPILTELPDDRSAELGGAYATSGECHPYVLMLGDYLKVATSGERLDDACYFMPESGACRVGQFGSQMRLAAEQAGAQLPIATRIEELLTDGTPGRVFPTALLTYW